MFYVKALHADGTTSVYQVESGPVTTGHGFWRDEQPDAKTVLGWSDWNFSVVWGEPDRPTGKYEVEGEVAGDCWELRYAWWHSDGTITGVITGYPIYILGENGKTIDRV